MTVPAKRTCAALAGTNAGLAAVTARPKCPPSVRAPPTVAWVAGETVDAEMGEESESRTSATHPASRMSALPISGPGKVSFGALRMSTPFASLVSGTR